MKPVTVIHADRQPAAGDGVGTAELMTRSGLTYRQVDFYCRAGYLRPGDGACPGTGYSRRFGEPEVLVGVLLKRLLDMGFTAAAAAGVARDHVEDGRWLWLADDGSLVIGARAEA